MPASGPVTDHKLYPSAVHEDQEDIMEGRQEPTVLGAPAFSSPNPETDALRMLPLEDGTSAHQAALDAASVRGTTDYKSMSPDELKSLAEERDLEVEGTGKSGAVKKSDLVAALEQDDASDLKASDFKDRVAATTDQDQLDEVATLYDNSGKSYKSVEAAIEKRQEELDAESK